MILSRGEIWLINLNPAKGHEQAGIRPALIISENDFNNGPAGLIVILPITSKKKDIPLHVKISPSESGLDLISYIKCEDIRSLSKERLITKKGDVSSFVLKQVEERIKILLGIY